MTTAQTTRGPVVDTLFCSDGRTHKWRIVGDAWPYMVAASDVEILLAERDRLRAALASVLDAGDYDDDGDFVIYHAPWDGVCDPPDTSDAQVLIDARAALAGQCCAEHYQRAHKKPFPLSREVMP